MRDVVTIGDAMITMNPVQKGPMRFSHTFERKVGGAELNVMLGAARLGLSTGWISRVGNDEFGQYILNFMRGEGVDTTNVVMEDKYNTPVNFKEIRENGSGSTYYYRFPSPTETIDEESISQSMITEAKILYVSGVFPSLREKNVELVLQAMKLAKENNVTVVMDPNIRLKLWTAEEAKRSLIKLMSAADVILSGKEEADLLFGKQSAEKHIQSFQSLGIQKGALKLGEEGAVGFDDIHSFLHLPAVKADSVADTVGAGDGFNAGYMYGMVQNYSLRETLRFANQIGSMVVAVSGDNEGLPYLSEVEQVINGEQKVER